MNKIEGYLREAFAGTCHNLQSTASAEVFAATGNPFNLPFDVVNSGISRFWTADFLEDLAKNEGSGIYIPITWMLDFSKRFWLLLELGNFSDSLEPTDNTYAAQDFGSCKDTIIEIVQKLVTDEKYMLGCESPLIAEDMRAYHTPLTYSIAGSGKSVLDREENDVGALSPEEFITTHQWLVPLYLLFITGTYLAVRSDLTARTAR